ncbi:hypothetical protein KM043_005621 [Ampulex compressa]|nr:hypothetical protein KM043_005621 [Ampulex compressa]
MEDFQYVVQMQKPQKICFGSGCLRDTSRQGMSPFMKYYTLEDHPGIAANSYNVLESFKTFNTKPCMHSISKRGYSGIARFGKQVQYGDDYPSAFDYNICTFPKQVKKLKYPFASTSKRETLPVNKNPGPGMYVDSEKREIKFEHSFGGRVKMRLGTDFKCCSVNTDVCKLCGKKPLGDYWHLNNRLFLCRICMTKEFQEQGQFKRVELKCFNKIRDCSSIHSHEGTNAKMWLMNPSDVAKWIRREAYLAAYFKN